MAFFGGGLFNDPFFSHAQNMMQQHMQQMDNMMGNLMDPFGMLGHHGHPLYGPPRYQMIEDQPERSGHYAGRSHPAHIRHPRSAHDNMSAMMPFGFGGGLFGGFGGLMNQMEQMRQHAINDPGAHVFSQSTVIGISADDHGRPQYYESTNSVRKAGEVKEVRKTVRDSREGLEKMSIGHHLGDGRAHIIEKSRDRTGEIKEKQEFHGINHNEAEDFDREWTSRTRGSLSDRNRIGGHRRNRALPIEERIRNRQDRSSPYRRTNHDEPETSSGPIIEEVE